MSDDYKTLSQNLAVKSLMGEFNAANGYGLIGSGVEQTANLDNIDPQTGEKKKDKDAQLMLFLDEMQRLDEQMRDTLNAMRDTLSNMANILDDIDDGLDDLNAQENRLKQIQKVLQNKDPEEMATTLLLVGFEPEEVDVMQEDGTMSINLKHVYEDTLEEYKATLAEINDLYEDYKAEKDAYNQNRENVIALRNEAKELGDDSDFEKYDAELKEMDTEFSDLEDRMGKAQLIIQQKVSPEIYGDAMKAFDLTDPKTGEFSQLGYVSEDQEDSAKLNTTPKVETEPDQAPSTPQTVGNLSF